MTIKRERKERPKDPGILGNILSGIVGKGVELIGLGGQALSNLAHTAQKRVSAIFMKLAVLLVLLLWVSVGIFLALLGLFYLLIDQAGVPRGIVFAAGGVIVGLVSLLLFKFAKQSAQDNDL